MSEVTNSREVPECMAAIPDGNTAGDTLVAELIKAAHSIDSSVVFQHIMSERLFYTDRTEQIMVREYTDLTGFLANLSEAIAGGSAAAKYLDKRLTTLLNAYLAVYVKVGVFVDSISKDYHELATYIKADRSNRVKSFNIVTGLVFEACYNTKFTTQDNLETLLVLETYVLETTKSENYMLNASGVNEAGLLVCKDQVIKDSIVEATSYINDNVGFPYLLNGDSKYLIIRCNPAEEMVLVKM